MRERSIISVLVFCLVFPILGYTQEGDGIQQVGRLYNIWDDANSVIIRDNLAFVSTSLTGLQILDVSDPSCPEIVGFFDNNLSFNTGLKLDENFAFLADGSGGICIVDVRDAENPEEIGIFQVGRVNAVDISGNTAFLAADWAGLRIVDVSDKSQPEEVSFAHIAGGAYDVVVSEGFAYVAGGSFGLYIINIEDPNNPEVVGNYDTPGSSRALSFNSGIVFLIDGDTGLFIIDVSTPHNPELLSLIELGNHTVDVTVSGDLALISDRDEGIIIFNIADLQEPFYVGQFQTHGWARSCDIVGDLVYVANGNSGYPNQAAGLEIFDISNLDSPSQLGAYPSPNQNLSNLTVYDGYAYLPDKNSGLKVIDVGNPEDPLEIGVCGDASWEGIIRISRSYAYMASDTFRVFDISNQEDPVVLSSFEIDSYATDLAIWRSSVYLTTQTCMYVIDISQPDNPVIISEFNDIDDFSPNGIDVAWGYAYITGDTRLYILDISDAENPVLISEFMANAGQMRGVASDGDLLYVVDDMAGLFILDITDRENPNRIGFLDIRPTPRNIVFSNGYVFVLNGFDGFRIIDVEDPANPNQVGYFNTPGFASDLMVVENYAYVADRFSFSIYNCAQAIGYNVAPIWDSVPEYIEVNAGEVVEFMVTASDINGDQLHIELLPEELPDSVCFIDNRNGTANFRWQTGRGDAGEYYPAFRVSDSILGDTARTAIVVNEIDNVKLKEGYLTKFKLLSVFPNPFNGVTTIAFETPGTDNLSLRLHSTTGSEITRIIESKFSAGNNRVVWDSRKTPAGIYFLVMETKRESLISKVVILR